MLSEDQLQSYSRAQKNGGFVELPSRCCIELQGADRATFLHNFCTADIKGLQIGAVAELFILDGRGKTLSFGHVAAFEDKLMVYTAQAGQAEALIEHLDKYIFREDVSIKNVSNEVASFFILGNSPASFATNQDLAQNRCTHFDHENIKLSAANIELDGFGIFLTVHRNDQQALRNLLADSELEPIPFDVFVIRRIEHGTPEFGKEIDDSNLPQELRRDEKAISFTKGCYLGQETVAKIDAFGHVNKFLIGLRFDERPQDGALLMSDDKKAGQLKTIIYSVALESWLGLAYVKCKLAQVGTELISESDIKGTVVQLPVAK